MAKKYLIPFGPLFMKKIFCKREHGIKKILGIYEVKLNKLIKKLLNKGDTCLDIGSHIGYTSMLISKYIGENGKVYAIDPSLENYELFSKTILENNYKNIIPKLCAIGIKTEDKEAYFYEDSNMYNIKDSGFLPNNKFHKIEKINTVKLVDFVQVNNLQEINFIKIDIEGYEKILFENLDLSFFDSFNPIFLIEIHEPLNGYYFKKYFNQLGYKMYNDNLNLIDDHFLDNQKNIFHAIFKK